VTSKEGPFTLRVSVRSSQSSQSNGEDHAKPSKEFLSLKTLIPPGGAGYSHIAKVNKGTTVYLSGQVSSDATGKLIGEGDFEAQVEQGFHNLKLAVEAAGGTMADIVKLNYYVVAELDQATVPKLRPIRDRYINVDPRPARSSS
jgi:enamine deaminase RidA (YjgF/YER057c/UK114 family)